MSNSVRPQRWQPTRLPCPWDSPGKNAGVGCHFLLQCMKVKSEREVAQSCPTLSNPMDCSLPGSSIHGIFQARILEWGAIAFSIWKHWWSIINYHSWAGSGYGDGPHHGLCPQDAMYEGYAYEKFSSALFLMTCFCLHMVRPLKIVLCSLYILSLVTDEPTWHQFLPVASPCPQPSAAYTVGCHFRTLLQTCKLLHPLNHWCLCHWLWALS